MVLPVRDAQRRTHDALDAVQTVTSAWQKPLQPLRATPLRGRTPVVDAASMRQDGLQPVTAPTSPSTFVRHDGRGELTRALPEDAGREELQRELDRARRSGNVLVLAFLGVHSAERSKEDRSLAGEDDVLGMTGALLVRCLRRGDVVTRIGRDLLVAALPGLTVEQAGPRMAPLAIVLHEVGPGTGARLWLSAAYGQDTVDAVLERTEPHLSARGRTGRVPWRGSSGQQRGRRR